MSRNSVEIVHNFWSEVWQHPYNLDAIDDLVTEDFVITTGGRDIVSRAAFKEWVREFLSQITDLHLEAVESFQNEDGSRVASRWVITGKNNGVMGTAPDQQPVHMTGVAVWAVGEDGRLQHNWVERAAWELHRRLHGDHH